ncbi:NPLOC4 [Bugula neritina]|nr:NPLOC4 [Bugula neritina]
MSVGFPKEQIYTFAALNSNKSPFPSCNRSQIGEIQSLETLASYRHQFEDDEILQCLADFNVLLYLCTCDVLPMREHMSLLLQSIKSQDSSQALQWAKSEQWSTMSHLLQASAPHPTTMGAVGRSTSFVGANASPLPPIGSTWQCNHCTFINTNPTTCDMCMLPK